MTNTSNIFEAPNLFQVELTNYCNIDCTMCARSAGLKRPIGHMDLGLFKKIVDQSKQYQMPIHWLHHFGDTLIYPHLREALQYFKSNGYGPGNVSTNAILLNEEKIDILLEYGGNILCCIDTMDPVAYKKIRNNNHFERVKRNIENLISERNRRNSDAQVVVQFLRTSHNMDEKLSEMMDHFGNHDHLRFIEKRTDKHPNGGDITILSVEHKWNPKRNCVKMHTEFCVLWSGECVPCCWDADGEQIIGDVKLNSINNIWQGELHKQMQGQLFRQDKGCLSLCDKCSGPVSDYLFGLQEQVNALSSGWVDNNKRIVLASANQAMFDLYEKSRLYSANIIAFCDAKPEGKVAPSNIPVIAYDQIEYIKPDIVMIFSPKYSTEIYFQQRHWRDIGIEVVVLGEFL